MSRLNRAYGWIPSKPSLKVGVYKPKRVKEADLPNSVDLRSTFRDPYDQGQLGSCTANGIAGVIEHRMIVANYKWQFRPSRLFIYYNERDMEGTVDQDAGAEIADGVDSINKLGVCPEIIYNNEPQPDWVLPYSDDANTFKQKPSDACYKDALLHQSLKDESVALTRANVLNTLAAGVPIVFGFTVYSSFESQSTMDTGIMKVPGFLEQVLGGHCVVAVGYLLNTPMGNQKIKDWVLVRNSWGTDVYGDLKGHFWMPLDKIMCNAKFTSDAHVITLMEGEEHKAS